MQPDDLDIENINRNFNDTFSFYHIGPDGEPLAGFGRGIGLRFVEYYFPKAITSITIASSYFSLEGYEAFRPYVRSEVRLNILIGRKQTNEAKKSIGYEIQKELSRATEPLYEAVRELLARIDQGCFTIRSAGEIQTSPRRPRFHCKFALCDDEIMFSGSANFTYYGLHDSGNEEQLILSQDRGTLDTAREFFQAAISKSRDLLEEVKQCLKEWFEMATPFQAYLRALDSMFNKPQPPLGECGLVPTYFQESVIARAVDSIAKYDGCLLLVGTGLGKTVIGAETILRSKATPFLGTVIVLAPRNLASSWHCQLASRSIDYKFFDTGLLFRASGPEDKEYAINRLETALAECNAETVILVDEAHKYRGALQKEAVQQRKNLKLPPEEHHRHHLRERFELAIARKARILLLTATPFGTSKQDINSLLSLLPPVAHTTANSISEWNIERLTDTAALPPVTVLGMHDVLYMARERGDTEVNGRLYIAMPDGSHKYLPKQIESHRIEFALPLSQEFTEAFEKMAFRGKNIAFNRFDDETDKNLTGIANATENNAVTAWISSLGDLQRIVKDYRELRPSDSATASSASGSDESEPQKSSPTRILDWGERRRLLQPLWEKLQNYQSNDDVKLRLLVKLLKQHRETKRKVIVFVRRYSTACYLEKQLEALLPPLSIGNTVREHRDKGELKSSLDRERIIRDFAPQANPGRHSKTFSPGVLICTDADGIGLNMQDASVVINYDLPLSADLLFQRVGRVMRMTDDPERMITVYTFLPEYSAGSNRLEKALTNLKKTMTDRHDKSAIVVGGSILPGGHDTLVIPMATKEDVDRLAKQFFVPEESLTENARSTDSHYALYDLYKDRMKQLPFTLLSAKNYGGAHTHAHLKDYRERDPHIVVCLQRQDIFRCILYNLASKEIIAEESGGRSSGILDLLKCEKAEPKAYVETKDVEKAAIEATQAWMNLQQLQQENEETEESSLTRICAVYLLPKTKREAVLSDLFTEPPPPKA